MITEQRAERLAPRVTRIAFAIGRQCGLPADEVEQEMWVSILTHAHRYPDDHNLVIKASLDARSRLFRANDPRRSAARYLPKTMRVVSLQDSLILSDEVTSWEETVEDANQSSVEETALHWLEIDGSAGTRSEVRQRVDGLNGRRRVVAEMLMADLRPSEIADRLGITRPAVSYHIGQLRKALAPYRSLCAQM